LDDSEEAQGVLRVAVSLASSYEAQLSLVRVVQMPPPTAELDFSPYKKDIMDAADDGLRTLQEKVGIDSPLAVVEATVAGYAKNPLMAFVNVRENHLHIK
jgi:nucleotide-binding universal stress UspA family protein